MGERPAARGHRDVKEADRFVGRFDDAVRAGRFTHAVTYFLTSDTLPSSVEGDASWGEDGSLRPPCPRTVTYDRLVVLFSLERLSPLPAGLAWRRLTDWPRHADVVPLTRVTVRTAPPTGEGTVFVARSGVGALAFDDPMEVAVWQPPEGGKAGLCRLVKHGSLVTGWAEIEVHPYGNGGSRGDGGTGETGGDGTGVGGAGVGGAGVGGAGVGSGASRVVWREDLRVRWLPGFCDRPLGWLARRMFGRAMDGLLQGPPPGR